jgi:hypothetical protein
MNSDDMHADPLLLASAYLDGELTADERTTAEADPAVMAEVEVLRALRAEVRDVELPTTEAREAAIAAAMAEFGAATAPTPPTPAPAREAQRVAPVPFRRRPTWYGPALGIAAAVVAIGLFGLVITQAGGGDDDAADDAGMIEQTAGAPEFERDSAEAADAGGEAADEATGDMAAELAADDGADTAGADTAEMSEAAGAEPTAAAEDTGDDALAEETGGRSDVDLGELPPATTGFSPDDPITTPAELAAFGRDLIRQRDDGVLGPTPETRCPTQVVLGTAWFESDGVVDEVLVAVDPPLEFVIIVDASTCVELERVELTLAE